MENIKHLNHIAIIPDGNRRWAKLHGVPVLEGHRRGAEAMHNVVEDLIARGIRYLTVWGFSMDNWKRTDNEVNDLLHLQAAWIERDAPWLNDHGVRLRHIGRMGELPDFLQLAINQAVELTSDNNGMTINLAFNYTGRTEIVDAVNCVVDEILGKIRRNGVFNVLADIPQRYIRSETFFARYLYTDGMPDVDLVIRTAGEVRLSNFMLWQTAYSEYYFAEILWPDFDEKELEKALHAYSERKRRFGGD